MKICPSRPTGGFAHDERGWQKYAARRQIGGTYAFTERLVCDLCEVRAGLVYSGERRRHGRGVVYVVESGEHHVLRNTQAQLLKRVVGTGEGQTPRNH